MSKELEAFEIIMGYKPNEDIPLLSSKIPFRIIELFPNESEILEQALKRLAEIESASGGEAMEELKWVEREIYDAEDYWSPTRELYINNLKNYILKNEAFREKVKEYFKLAKHFYTLYDGRYSEKFEKIRQELNKELGVKENE